MHFKGILNLCDLHRPFFSVCHSGVVVALETPQGSLIRVPQHVSSEDYSSALSQRDAQAVVANLLGIVAAHRGVQHAPLAMLASQTKVFLALYRIQTTIVCMQGTPALVYTCFEMVLGPCTLNTLPPLHAATPYPVTTSPTTHTHHITFGLPPVTFYTLPPLHLTDSLAMS